MATDRSRPLLAAGLVLSLLSLAAPPFLARAGSDSPGSGPAPRLENYAGTTGPVRDAPQLPPPQTVAALFGWRPVAVPAAPPSAPAPVKSEPRADWILPMGQVETAEGTAYLFLKDRRSGRVFRVRLDGRPEGEAVLLSSDEDTYRIRYGDETYIVPRRP